MFGEIKRTLFLPDAQYRTFYPLFLYLDLLRHLFLLHLLLHLLCHRHGHRLCFLPGIRPDLYLLGPLYLILCHWKIQRENRQRDMSFQRNRLRKKLYTEEKLIHLVDGKKSCKSAISALQKIPL